MLPQWREPNTYVRNGSENLQLVRTLGVGRAVRNGSEWGSPDVSDSLRRSVRKLAMRLREIGEWKAMGELVDNIKAKEGLTDAENVLGFPYAEVREPCGIEDTAMCSWARGDKRGDM